MRIDFKPQRLLDNLVFEEKIIGGVRRVIQTQGKKAKTIEMELSNLDSLGNAYPKEYYVSSYKVYGKDSSLLKMMNRQVTDTANSETSIVKRNFDGKYDKSMIVRNNQTVIKS